MTQTANLRWAFNEPPPLSHRELRAMRTRQQALSPVRILLNLLMIPVVTVVLTVSIYTRTSPYGSQDALRHIIALAGCTSAARVGVAPARRGELGYHTRNDPDGDGVACDDVAIVATAAPAPDAGNSDDQDLQRDTAAKFLRP